MDRSTVLFASAAEPVEFGRHIAILHLPDARPFGSDAGEQHQRPVLAVASQTGVRLLSFSTRYSEKLVKGTRQRCATLSHRFQCAEPRLRTLVTPGPVFLFFSAKAGDGIPHSSSSARGRGFPVHDRGGRLGKIAGRAARLPVSSVMALAIRGSPPGLVIE